MPAPSPETNTDVHPSDTHMYNACLKHIHKDIHTHAPHAHLDVCVWSPQTYPHSYTHNQPSNKHTLQTQANPCVHSLKTWMPIHIPLKHRQTDRQDSRAHFLTTLCWQGQPPNWPARDTHGPELRLAKHPICFWETVGAGSVRLINTFRVSSNNILQRGAL